jgi:hypothetical protein
MGHTFSAKKERNRDMMKLIPFLKCKVMMHNPDKADLTGKEEISWADCVIKPDEIIAIRRCEQEGYENCAVLHFRHNDCFIVDLDYDKAIIWWTGGASADKFIDQFNQIFGG